MSSSIRTFRLSDVASKFADYPAIISQNGIIAYPDYVSLVNTVSRNLKEMGFGAGDRIGIFSANSFEYIVLLLAIFGIKAVAVLLNTRLPLNQVLNALDEVDCRAVFYSNKNFEKQKLGEIDSYDINEITSSLAGSNHIGAEEEIALDQDATIVFTSGSTSNPKAVLHTFGNHFYSALGSNLNIPFDTGDKWLLSLPLYHVGGLAIVFRALINGGAVITTEERMHLLDSMAKFQPTHISLVATQLYRLLKENTAIGILQRMKAILLGGSAIPPLLARESIKHQLSIFTSYGSTEMASQITTTRPGDNTQKLFTSGRLLNNRQLKISADGEILVKGDTLFKGYVQRNGIKSSLTADGWFPTGDMGRLDGEGYLTVTGRKDNMFVSGGENIQPEEIEQELNEIQGVKEAIVVQVKNEEYGERPVAFIDIEGEFPGDVFFQGYLDGKIARFKIPDHFFPMPEDQLKSGIKAERSLLKKRAEALVADIS